jgi:adenine-specific DNA-methyltransferase
MDKLDPKTHGRSPDLTAENVAQLRELFPEVFTEGRIDFDALRKILGDHVDDRAERYGLSWSGKGLARQIAQQPSTATLRPVPEESVNWDTTQNLFIEGDNLEVLKLLQKSYHRKVKMIYIDPPYNTGKEFIYPDRYQDNLDTYLRYTGQVDGDGLKLTANIEAGGRYHTNWLNMMYPRLKLSRNLLSESGVIFVSIDDREVANLKQIMDEVFGGENFLGTVIWKNATDNNPTQVAVEHEYIMVYSRDKASASPAWKTSASDVKQVLLDVGHDFTTKYSNPDERQAEYSNWFNEHKSQLWPMDRYKYIDNEGIYIGSQSVHNPGREGYRYDILHPDTGLPCKQPLMGYRFPRPTIDEMLKDGRIIFGEDHNKIIEIKVYAKDFSDKLSSVLELDGRAGTYDLRSLFPEAKKIFTNPKPVSLLIQLFSFVLGPADLCVDFFAGSGASGEAVMRLNEMDGGQRRFILVQLPEPIDDSTEAGQAGVALGFSTISEVCAERLRRAGRKTGATKSGNRDTGFRFLKLASTNVKPWDGTPDYLEPNLFDAIDNVKPDRTEQDVLFELLLKYGLDLAMPVEERVIAGRRVFILGAGALVVCLARDIDLAVAEGIAAMKPNQPDVMRVVFRDASFRDDVVKTNAVQILRRAGVDDIKSL